ncbi:MAG: thiamine pyrophosphate-binding protein [Gemmatimonadales bacterium]|nr:thiamine pyrophosphate-binding protein [Gemmatimonadales bacterium]
MTGYDLLCRTLETLGIDRVFGLPGSQNVPFFEALRRSNVRVVVPAHELGAAFMAIGASRASGKVSALTTIPGPGFTYAITGLAEARLDSVPLLHIVQRPATEPGNRFQLQTLDQAAIAGPVVKQVLRIDGPSEVATVIAKAHELALRGEPGPVLVEVDSLTLSAEVTGPSLGVPSQSQALPECSAQELSSVLGLVAGSHRPMLLVGQGGNAAAADVQLLAERLSCPVLTSTSGRGIMAEDHPLVIPSDLCDVRDVNALVAESDLVLALGIKFSHNGARGFRLRIPPARLVHVDAALEVLGVNYPANLAIHSDVSPFVSTLLKGLSPEGSCGSTWSHEEVAAWRRRVRSNAPHRAEPEMAGVDPPTPAKFFELIREVLPRDACLVTDSGWHQMLARRHYPVLAPGGLMVPTNLQSMGFGLPAAIGAKLATPDRSVAVVTGDGGVLMSGMDLVTAVRERISLPVLVLNDGQYGLIRIQQLRDFGRPHGVDCSGLDFQAFAAASGARYVSAGEDIRAALRTALNADGPTLIEVAVGDSQAIRRARVEGLVRSTGRRLGGGRLRNWLRGTR